jgi:hypothetical protein
MRYVWVWLSLLLCVGLVVVSTLALRHLLMGVLSSPHTTGHQLVCPTAITIVPAKDFTPRSMHCALIVPALPPSTPSPISLPLQPDTVFRSWAQTSSQPIHLVSRAVNFS